MDKKKLLRNTSLYVLLDKGLTGARDITGVAEQLIRGGAGIVQYRDKVSEDKQYLENAMELYKILRRARALFIINDRLDVAWYIDADGVHLGQDDLPVRVARKLLKKNKIIGRSAETVEQAVAAQNEGADYIGLGPMFHTTTKPIKTVRGLKLLRESIRQVKIPCFAIGGINLDNLSLILEAGCDKVVVGSAILNCRDIVSKCSEFLERLRGDMVK
jgi:thiamine-phosphate diphosphorylase